MNPNIEEIAIPRKVWALFEGKEGEDPSFSALFFNEEQANQAAESSIFFDAYVAPALFVEGKFVWANDFHVTNHEELEAAIERKPEGGAK